MLLTSPQVLASEWEVFTITDKKTGYSPEKKTVLSDWPKS